MTISILGNENIYTTLPDYVKGGNVNWISTSELSIDPFLCRNTISSFPGGTFYLSSENTLPISSSIIGSGGLDTGEIEASTVYAVYAISQSSGYLHSSVIISKSIINPYMPSGYDLYRRIGWAITNISGNFIKTFCIGNGDRKDYIYNEFQTAISTPADDFTTVSLASIIPPIKTLFKLDVILNGDSEGDTCFFRTNATSDVHQIYVPSSTVNEDVEIDILCDLNAGVPSIQYKTSTGLSINAEVVSFVDYL